MNERLYIIVNGDGRRISYEPGTEDEVGVLLSEYRHMGCDRDDWHLVLYVPSTEGLTVRVSR